jgi:hypothetical protein
LLSDPACHGASETDQSSITLRPQFALLVFTLPSANRPDSATTAVVIVTLTVYAYPGLEYYWHVLISACIIETHIQIWSPLKNLGLFSRGFDHLSIKTNVR